MSKQHCPACGITWSDKPDNEEREIIKEIVYQHILDTQGYEYINDIIKQPKEEK